MKSRRSHHQHIYIQASHTQLHHVWSLSMLCDVSFCWACGTEFFHKHTKRETTEHRSASWSAMCEWQRKSGCLTKGIFGGDKVDCFGCRYIFNTRTNKVVLVTADFQRFAQLGAHRSSSLWEPPLNNALIGHHHTRWQIDWTAPICSISYRRPTEPPINPSRNEKKIASKIQINWTN